MCDESRDALKEFCETYISRNGRNRSTNGEWELASAFVEFFGIPPLSDVSGLEGFLARTNIEIRKGELPAGLLAVNMSFEGKRRIDVSVRREQLYFQVHTVLHEIREIIENDFRRLGHETTYSQDLEHCANEFAFGVIVCSLSHLFGSLFDNAWEIQSTWRRWGVLALIGIGVVAVSSYSFIGAFFPHVSITQSGIRFEK